MVKLFVTPSRPLDATNALFCAVQLNRLEAVQELIEAGFVDINSSTCRPDICRFAGGGKPPLMVSVLHDGLVH